MHWIEHEHTQQQDMSVNIRTGQELYALNGCSPRKGRRSGSRPSTSDSEYKQGQTNNEQNRQGRSIDQAGRQQASGKQINSVPHSFFNNSEQSAYLPSFSDSSQTKKRTKKLSKVSGDLLQSESIPPQQSERRRHSHADVYLATSSITENSPRLEQNFPLSPNMKRVGQSNKVRKRPSLGLSTGPVTSSLQLDIRRPARSVSLQTDSRVYQQQKIPGPSEKGELKEDLLSPLNRPTAPFRSEEAKDIFLRKKSSTNQGPMNTLSLDNWLSSLPDSKPNENSNCSKDENMPNTDKSTDLEIKEIEDFEDESGCIGRPSSGIMSFRKGVPITLEQGRDLKHIMFGESAQLFSAGWIGQAFTFNSNKQLGFGFVQMKGGPCGVLAAVQATLMKVLMFGSKQFAVSKSVNPLAPSNKERSLGLATALSDILTKCSTDESYTVALSAVKKHISSGGKFRTDGITETLNLHKFSDQEDLFQYMKENVGYFMGNGNSSVVAFLYSCILTHGIETVKSDMDSPEIPLMGAHGYCSQEMVNLLLTGRATSNVFDKDVVLGSGEESTVLKGIHSTSDIGLITLYEHYKSCRVGDFLKCPLYPIWVICSESHFSLLFSQDLTLSDSNTVMDFWYYDGLARQETIIKLTVDQSGEGRDTDFARELISPIEHCIRTKWPWAHISWNGSEPIL